jgi:hypothetical protein
MPIPKAQEVKLSDAERQGLEKLLKRHQVGQQIALRAKIVLAAANGLKNKQIVAKYAVQRTPPDCGEIVGSSYKTYRWTT